MKAKTHGVIRKNPGLESYVAVRTQGSNQFGTTTTVSSVTGKIGATSFPLDFDPKPVSVDKKTIIVVVKGLLVISSKSKAKVKRVVATRSSPDAGDLTITLTNLPGTVTPPDDIPVVFVDDIP